MASLLCMAILYLLFQLNIAFFRRKLINWDNPKWMPTLYKERQKQNKRSFIIQWTLIALGGMFVDVMLVLRMTDVFRSAIDAFIFWPFITFAVFASYAKAEFIHLMYHAWGILKLKEKLKQRGKD